MVQFTVFVPASPSPAARGAKFTTPAGAQSVTFVLGSGTPTVLNLTASTPGCTSAPAGLTCQVSVSAPAGSDVFTVTSYSAPNAGGTVLGSGSVAVTATPGQTTVAPTTLTGTVASVAISIAQSVPAGVNGTVPVTIVAKDSSGNAIIGTYASPITLSDTDASGQTSLSATAVPDSTTAAAITLTYKGGAMSAPAVIGATASGVAASNIASANFSPDEHFPASGQTLTYAYSTNGQYTPVGQTPSPTFTSSATRTDVLTSGQTFGSVSNVIDDRITYTYGATPSPYHSDTYYQFSASAPYSLGFVGITNNTNTTETCAAPYENVYVSGSPSWDGATGIGACTTVSIFGTGSNAFTNTFVFNADGSYSALGKTASQPSTVFSKNIVNPDGTATIENSSPSGSSVVTIYTPAPNASTIPENVQAFPGTTLPPTLPTPGPANTSIPNWYPLTGVKNSQPPKPLVTNTFSAATKATLPSSCPVASSLLGSTPDITKVEENWMQFDPTGYFETDITDTYLLNGVGTICIVDKVASVGNGSPPVQGSLTQVFYATASTLKAASAQRGVAQAMQMQGAMLMSMARAGREQRRINAVNAAMLRTTQAIQQRSRSVIQ